MRRNGLCARTKTTVAQKLPCEYERSDASSENNHEVILVAVMTIFWVSMMNELYYGC
jgi:hypothetical protein